MPLEIIHVSADLKQVLKKMKVSSKETYEEIIWNMIEDKKELSEQTKKDILKAREEVAKGHFVKLEDLNKKYGIKDQF